MMPDSEPDAVSLETQKLSRLVDLSVQLNSMLNLDELLHRIIHTAAELLDCEAASILLYDEKQPHLFFAATSDNHAEELKQMEVPIEDSLAGIVFRSNRPINVHNAAEDPRHYATVAQQMGLHVRSLLAFPMRMRDRLIGVIEALNKHDGGFSAEDEKTLDVITSLAAVAINNARLVQALQQALKKSTEADRLKKDFLSLASHELRTPLGIIIGYATFLREDASGELSEHADHVLNAALQMRSLVEDMTNLTLLETDGLVFRSKAVSVQDILASAVHEVQMLAQARDLRLVYDLPDAPLLVHIDDEKTVSAFVNLLNNAIRFSSVGGRIVLGARDEDNHVLFWVKDYGIGIDEEQLEKIFREFYQAEPSLTRRFGGLGIGLTIARGLIEAQGGRIWAESEGKGKGATFNVSFPKE